MRFASDFVAAGQTPVPRRVENIDKAAFEVLTIDVTGFWPGQHTIVIHGDGAYTFDKKDYHAVYQLRPEHLGQLVGLLKATDWLTRATGRAMVPDATTYAFTLDREGRRTKVASDDTQQDPYKELIRLIRRIERQETLLHQTTNPTQQDSAAHELRSELAALKGQPIAMPYALILDHNRLVPVFAEWLAKPQGRSEDALAAAAEWVAYLEIESQRPNLEAIARGRVPDEPEFKVPSAARIAAVTALGPLGGGRSLSLLESLEADNDSFVRDAVADAVLSAPPNEAIPILQEMAADSRAAAWALIRLGGQAESAIIEILAEPIFRSSGPENLIREYYEHWKELPAPPNAAIVKAIRDRVQADAKDGPPDRYGLEVLKLSGDSLEEVQR